MAPPVGSLVVRIGSDIRGLSRGFRQGTDIVKRFGAVASRTAKRIAVISTVAAAAGLAIGVKLTRDGLKSVDAMTKLGRSVGATQAEMVALNATADLVGIAQEKMQKNIGAFTKRLGEAMDGTGQAVDALKKLGFTAEELAAMPLPEALALVAERTQLLGTAAERAAVESDLFSRAGIGMLTTTGDLAGAIRQATKDTQQFGVAVSQVDAAKIEDANDAMGRIGLVIKGVSNQLALQLAPFLEKIADTLTDAARESKGFGKAIETGLEAGIELSVLFARSMRLAAIAALSTAIAVEKVRGQTTKGNTGLTRFLARARLVGDAAGTMELDRQFREADKASAGAALSVSGLEKALLGAVESSGTIDKIGEALKRVKKDADDAREAFEFVSLGPPIPPDLEMGGDDPELEALREKLATRLEIIRESLLTEGQMERDAFDEKMARLQEGRAEELLSEGEFQAQREGLEEQFQARITDIQERADDERKRLEELVMQARINTAFGAAKAVASIVENAARENFALQKAASIASTIISAIEAGVHSYRFGAQIAGPALGAAMAAVAVAANAAPLAAIRSADFKRGGTAPAAGAGAPTPALPPGQGGGGGGGAGGGSQSVNISLVGDSFGRTQVRDLIEEINSAVADGARLRVV